MANRFRRQGGMGPALAHEVQRQARARLIARSPLGPFMNTYYRMRGGSFSNPRYLVSAVGGIVVLLGGAFVTCAGFLTALFSGGFRH